MRIKTKISGFEFRGFARTALAAIFSIAICLGLATGTKAAPAAIKLSAPTASVTVNPGQTATYTVKITRNGYLDKVSLSATGAPAGTTVAFSPNLTTTSSSTMTVTTPTSITAGVYQIKVNALETATGSAAAPIFVSLRVNPPPVVTLTATPRSQSIVAGNRAVYEIAFNRNTFTGPINLSVAGLPIGATPSFTYSTNGATLTISTSLNIGRTQMFPTISGTAPGASVTPITLTFRTNAGLSWTSSFNLGYFTWPTGVTQDTFGNVFVISRVETAESTDWINYHVCKITKYLSNGTLAWTRTLDDIDQNEFDVPLSVVTDSSGNIYVAGGSAGRIDPSIFTAWPVSSQFRWWLAKYNGDGILQWTRQDPVDQDSFKVTVDLDRAQNPVLRASGNSRLQSGNTRQQRVVFDGNGQILQNTTATLPNRDYDQIVEDASTLITSRVIWGGDPNRAVISKQDSNGTLVWEKQIMLDGYSSYCREIILDSTRNVIAACWFAHAQGGILHKLFRLDANTGNVIWEKPLPEEISNSASILRLHTDGDLLVGYETYQGSRLEKYETLSGRRQWFRNFDKVSFQAGMHPFGSNSILLTGFDGRSAIPSGTIHGMLFYYRMPNTASLPSGLVINPPTVLPGAQITMWGNNLSNVEEVRVGTTSVQFTIVSATEIRFNLPNLAPGQYEVSVRTNAEYVPASLPLTVF